MIKERACIFNDCVLALIVLNVPDSLKVVKVVPIFKEVDQVGFGSDHSITLFPP